MYNVIIFLEVAIAEWRYDHETKQKYADGYLAFYREINIPFPPYIGLQLSTNGWMTQPLESVRYDIDLNKFICNVPADNEIPDKLDRLIQNGDKSDEEIDAYVNSEIEMMKDAYRDMGWGLFKGTKYGEST